jgi:hypothetical protein
MSAVPWMVLTQEEAAQKLREWVELFDRDVTQPPKLRRHIHDPFALNFSSFFQMSKTEILNLSKLRDPPELRGASSQRYPPLFS